jgi:hypothetical protein
MEMYSYFWTYVKIYDYCIPYPYAYITFLSCLQKVIATGILMVDPNL